MLLRRDWDVTELEGPEVAAIISRLRRALRQALAEKSFAMQRLAQERKALMGSISQLRASLKVIQSRLASGGGATTAAHGDAGGSSSALVPVVHEDGSDDAAVVPALGLARRASFNADRAMRAAQQALAVTAEVAKDSTARADSPDSEEVESKRPQRLASVAMSSRLAATASSLELRREREALLQYVRSLEDERADAVSESKQLRADLAHVTEQATSLHSACTDMRKALSETVADLGKKQQTVVQLRGSLQASTAALEQAHARYNELYQESNASQRDLRAKLSDVKKVSDAFRHRHGSLADRMSAKEVECQRLRSLLEDANRGKAAQQHDAEQAHQTAVARIARLAGQVESLRKELDEARQTPPELPKVRAELESQVQRTAHVEQREEELRQQLNSSK